MGVGSISIVAMDHAANLLSHADVVINTIPGLAADPIAEAFASAGIVTNGTLLDVVYDPRPTKLMQAWRSCGGTAIGGEEMLLYQAMIQVWLMTGIWDNDPPTEPPAIRKSKHWNMPCAPRLRRPCDERKRTTPSTRQAGIRARLLRPQASKCCSSPA